MKKPSGQLILLLSLIAILSLPHIVAAYTAPNIWPTGFWGPLVSCSGNYIQGSTNYLPNDAQHTGACQSVCDLIGTILNIIYFAITLCLFVLAPIMFAIGGVMLMVSGANPEMLSQGKRVLLGAVIGVVIVLVAYTFVVAFITFMGITGIGGFGVGGNTFSCNAS